MTHSMAARGVYDRGPDTLSHPPITGTEPYRWTLDQLRAAVVAQAREDAARGVSVVPWRGLARSMERLAPDWRDERHNHRATYGYCPLDEAREALERLYADEERIGRLAGEATRERYHRHGPSTD